MSEFVSKNYRRLLDLRREGLARYHAKFPHQFLKLPVTFTAPHPILNRKRRSALHSLGLRHYDAGSRICVTDRPVPWVLASKLIRNGQSVLDIGCSDGMFGKFLTLSGIEVSYAGVDVDTSFAPDFPLFHSIGEVKGKFDVATLFHVIEHIPMEGFLDILERLPGLLEGPETAILATPNVLSPGVFERDIEHVQPYPWYDLYAILRFHFQLVDVLRGHYLCTPLRILSLPAKMVSAALTERDWCEEVILIARHFNGHNKN